MSGWSWGDYEWEDMELPVVVPAQTLEGGEVVPEPLKLLVHRWKGFAQTLSGGGGGGGGQMTLASGEQPCPQAYFRCMGISTLRRRQAWWLCGTCVTWVIWLALQCVNSYTIGWLALLLGMSVGSPVSCMYVCGEVSQRFFQYQDYHKTVESNCHHMYIISQADP